MIEGNIPKHAPLKSRNCSPTMSASDRVKLLRRCSQFSDVRLCSHMTCDGDGTRVGDKNKGEPRQTSPAPHLGQVVGAALLPCVEKGLDFLQKRKGKISKRHEAAWRRGRSRARPTHLDDGQDVVVWRHLQHQSHLQIEHNAVALAVLPHQRVDGVGGRHPLNQPEHGRQRHHKVFLWQGVGVGSGEARSDSSTNTIHPPAAYPNVQIAVVRDGVGL